MLSRADKQRLSAPFFCILRESNAQLNLFTQNVFILFQNRPNYVSDKFFRLLYAAADIMNRFEHTSKFLFCDLESRICADPVDHIVFQPFFLYSFCGGQCVDPQFFMKLLAVPAFFTALIMIFSVAINGNSLMTLCSITLG